MNIQYSDMYYDIIKDNTFEYDHDYNYDYDYDYDYENYNLQENIEYKYENLKENICKYEYVYNKIKHGKCDDQILLKSIILYLINFESETILEKNKIRFLTELLLKEENINIFICISSNFDPNFYVHDYSDKNFRTPDLELYLTNRIKLYNNKNFNLQFYIDPDLEWLYDNIIALNRWNNNTDELYEDIKFTTPPYLKSIINNLKTSYNFYLKKIKKNKVIITYK